MIREVPLYQTPAMPTGSVQVQRRVSTDGRITVDRQPLKLGARHARKTVIVIVIVGDTHFRVLHGEEEIAVRQIIARCGQLNNAAAAVAARIDPVAWADEFEVLFARVAPAFARVQPRRRAKAFVQGLWVKAILMSCLARIRALTQSSTLSRFVGAAFDKAVAVRQGSGCPGDAVHGMVSVKLPDAVEAIRNLADVTAKAGWQCE